MKPLIYFEERFIVTKMSSVLGVSNHDVVILHAFFKFNAIFADNRVIICEEEQGWNLYVFDEGSG